MPGKGLEFACEKPKDFKEHNDPGELVLEDLGFLGNRCSMIICVDSLDC